MSRFCIAVVVVGMLIAAQTALGIAITPYDTSLGDVPGDLVDAILGTGITYSNAFYTGVDGASGFFTGGLSSGIGIDKGIILTSGAAAGAVGPNNDDGFSVGNYVAGDSQLNAIVSPDVTYDATVLEFDFVSDGGDLFFRYVFASEEYNEFVFSYNDPFAFFLDGTNIALVPGTSTEVSVDTVNKVVNPGYYNNNDLSDGPPPFNIQYDGFTDVFFAQALGLAAGTHHIELAIADTNDYALDSAVFIEAGSFSDEQIPEPSTMMVWSLLATCAAGAGWFRRRKVR